jgi:C-terminal processing protease CtpA/Prc
VQYETFSLGQQLPDADRKSFSDALFANWARADTAAALQWANQLTDPAEQNEALQAIHTTAPVGIGALLRMDDGYPVIAELLPGGAADLSGQLQAGDRIVAVQSAPELPFQNLQNVPLADVVQAIRGEPNTLVQLQIIPAEASPESPPQTISITRSQLIIK